MSPPDNDRDEDGSQYFTEERLDAYGILTNIRRSARYRSYLALQARNEYRNIKEGKVDYANEPRILEERNALRTLSAQIISETYNILEGLAAISMNPGSSPGERAFKMLTYNVSEIDDFYDSYDEDTDLEFFKSILAYPKMEDVDIDPSDKEYYQEVLDASAKSYKAFYLVARDARNIIRKNRHKFTHGFLLALFDRVAGWQGNRVYPEGCDDIMTTMLWDGEVKVKGLLTGERPHDAYLRIVNNATSVQHQIANQLIRQMLNQGDPVYPEAVFGSSPKPDYEPDSNPSYTLIDVNMDISARFSQEHIQPQLDLFNSVESLQSMLSQPQSDDE